MTKLRKFRSKGEVIEHHSPAKYERQSKYDEEMDDVNCSQEDSPWTSQEDFSLQKEYVSLEHKVKAIFEELSVEFNKKEESTSRIWQLSRVSLALIWRLDCAIDSIMHWRRKVQRYLNGNSDSSNFMRGWIPLALCDLFIGPVMTIVNPWMEYIGSLVTQSYNGIQERLQSKLRLNLPQACHIFSFMISSIQPLRHPLAGLKLHILGTLQLSCRENLPWFMDKVLFIERYVPFGIQIKALIEHLKDMVLYPSQLEFQPITPGEVKHVTRRHETVLVLQLQGNRYRVVAGTVERLLHQLCSNDEHENEFIECFLHCHHLFMSSLSLLNYLFKKYLTESRKCIQAKQRKKQTEFILERVTNVLTLWLSLRYQDFHRDTQMFSLFSDFLHQMQLEHQVAIRQLWAEKMSKSIRYSTKQPPQHSTNGQYLLERYETKTQGFHYLPYTIASFALSLLQRTPKTPAVYPFSYHSILLDMDELTIARVLCYADLELFKKLTIYQFLLFQTKQETKPQQNEELNEIHTLVERSNMIRSWVACELCTILDLNERHLLIRKFIHIAKLCKEMNSFHTAMMITSGLLSNPVQFLKRSWKLLSNSDRNAFDSVEKLLNVSGNMKYYRTTFTKAKSPGTPFLPLLLKDVTFLVNGLPTFIHERSCLKKSNISGELVNFSKFREMTETIEQTMRITRGKYMWKREMNSLFDIIEGRIHDWYHIGGKKEETLLLEWSKICEG
ncbi:hypothetical protein K7432_011065 [Basidiobolus ranarum]|uniref:Ras-GEF domain-containing protein n=1 Tax=Basidiobolus ranarum TaxID=34480 RepID=A0ABR2WMW1_9FUNG